MIARVRVELPPVERANCSHSLRKWTGERASRILALQIVQPEQKEISEPLSVEEGKNRAHIVSVLPPRRRATFN